jgi:hypothetical protein
MVKDQERETRLRCNPGEWSKQVLSARPGTSLPPVGENSAHIGGKENRAQGGTEVRKGKDWSATLPLPRPSNGSAA